MNTPLDTTLSGYTRAALISAVVFGVLVIAACFFIKISGAVQAGGIVVANGQNSILQHPDGGLIIEVAAETGSAVDAGDLLMRLDGRELMAEDARLKRRQLELQIQINRLNAALEGETEFASVVIRGRDGQTTEAGEIEALQSSALLAETALLRSEINAALTQAKGAQMQLDSLRKQRGTNQDRLTLIEEEIAPLRALVADRLVPQSRLTRLERERLDILQREQALQLEETRLNNLANDARNTATTIARRADDRLWKNREDATRNLADISRQIEQIELKLGRLDITAPVSGRIHELAAENPGIFLAPGDVALQIVPKGGGHQVRVQIPAAEIDDIYLGQPARVRFDTYRHMQMPELTGQITRLAPDRSLDPQTGIAFFSAIISFDDTEADRLSQISPDAGLPVTVLITTQKRSLASYLVSPVQAAFSRTFSEN